MKILGHPIHIMLIHFPSALLPVHVLFAIVGKYTFSVELIKAAFFVLVIGCLMGWLALIFGLIDLLGVIKNRENLIQKVLIHGSINAVVLIGFSVFALIPFKSLPVFSEDAGQIILIKSALILLLFVGNYRGGDLVLKHKIGIEP